jgi:hypothetical protein
LGNRVVPVPVELVSHERHGGEFGVTVERIEALPIEPTQKQRLVSRVRARAPKTPDAGI